MKNKELEPLQVSKQLKDFVLEFIKNGLDRRFIHGSFDIIETALKDYTTQKQRAITYYKIIENLDAFLEKHNVESLDELDIKLKALEAIKKYFNIANLIAFLPQETQNRFKEEFDLLKRVML